MTVEVATYIDTLDATYPTSNDPKSEGDNHLRLIKQAIKATFPNITGPVTKTQAQLNAAVGDVTGPASSVDNTLPRFDGTTGKLLQGSSATLDDAGGFAGVTSINGGQLAGMRNKIINGNFGINQRGYVSGAATTAGQYTLDRWKVTGTGGVTFSTTANKTTVTIPSGQTLQQVIEGLNLETGTYVLSWGGTAQGRIAGGSYGASGSVTASVVGGTDTTIEFNAGTVETVMLEKGTVATPFEHRPYGAELALCRRYLPGLADGSGSAGNGVVCPGLWDSTTSAQAFILFDVPPRTNPTGVTVSAASHFLMNNPGTGNPAATAITFTDSSLLAARVTVSVASGGGAAGVSSFLRLNSASAKLLFTGCEL